jgi:hypothetical protein
MCVRDGRGGAPRPGNCTAEMANVDAGGDGGRSTSRVWNPGSSEFTKSGIRICTGRNIIDVCNCVIVSIGSQGLLERRRRQPACGGCMSNLHTIVHNQAAPLSLTDWYY